MKPKLILIVDDQAFIRHILGMDLARNGYEICQAENGKAAIDEAVQRRPDLILLDIMMPVLDGYETCRRLREHPATAKTPVIFLSANNQKTAVIKAVQSGGNDFVVKSPNSAILIQKIKKIFNEEPVTP